MKFPTSIRHGLLVVGMAAAAATALAPVASAASPASVVQSRRVADAIADEANHALSLLDQLEATEDSSIELAYQHERADIAAAIGERLDIEPALLSAAWAAADFDHQRALMAALSQMGVPYRRNTSKVGVGFDCSGLTTYAWSRAGFALQRSSSSQIRAAVPMTADTAQAGDLVQYPGHVMMWLGVDRAIVHAPYPGRNVEVDVLSSRRRIRFGDPTS